MDSETYNKLLQEKDQQIADLKGQITTLTNHVADLSSKLSEFLANQVRSNNIKNPNNQNSSVRNNKRRAGDIIDFRAKKNGNSTRPISAYLISSKPSETNSGDLNSDDKMDDDDELANNDATNNTDGEIHSDKHNHTSVNLNAGASTSWAEAVNSDELSTETEKTTPIQIGNPGNNNYSGILKLIRDSFESDTYEWIQMRQSASPRVICRNQFIKNSIMQLLHDNGVEYNTFSDKFNKKKAFIIRGMVNGHDDDNIACIRESLGEYQVSGILSVARFFTPHMKRNENSNVLYQLVLAAGSDESQLAQIKTIDNFRVKFEKMNTTKTVQCRRCQRFC